jgi:zinc protease
MTERHIAPEIQPIERIDLLQHKQIKHPSGLLFTFLNDNEFDVVKIELVFKVGSKHEEKSLLAQFTNTLIFEGTETLSSEEIAEKFEFYGAQVKTNISSDRSSVSLICLKDHLTSLLPFFLDVIFSANYPRHEIELYAKRKKQDFLLSTKKVAFLAGEQLNKALFSGTHYHMKMDQNSFEDVNREEVLEFYNNHYKNNAFDVFSSGNINEQATEFIMAACSKYASSSKDKKTFKPIIQNNAEEINLSVIKGTQSCVKFGKILDVGFASDDFFALKFINTLFGGYFGSRLMQNIREDKGYTYGIGSSFLTLEDAKYFVVSTEVDNSYVQPTLNEINKEFDKICEEEVSQNELELVKNYIKGSLLKANDGVFLTMENLKHFHYFNTNLEYFNAYFSFIDKVDAQKVKAIAKQYLQKNTFTTVVVS